MVVLCLFTDAVAATVLSYEKPEADVLHRRPRNVKKDRLVNWQLIFQAYGIIGITETIASFTLSYWYLQRRGITFKDLWFSFGQIPTKRDRGLLQHETDRGVLHLFCQSGCDAVAQPDGCALSPPQVLRRLVKRWRVLEDAVPVSGDPLCA